MRFFLIFTLCFLTLVAEEKKQSITLGLGSYVQTQPYQNVDTLILPSPVIFFDNGLLYVRWTRVGLYFLGEKQDSYAWGFSLTAQPRTYGYNSDDIAGMDERETSWEGGLAFSASKDDAWIEVMALTDILDRYDSFMIKTEFGYDFKYKELSFYPSLIATYQSSKFLNYYYGIKESEIMIGSRNIYRANHGFQLGIQTYIKYPLTKNLSTLINLKVDKISNEATDSPIVNQSYIYSGLASLIYTFEF